MIDVIVPVYAGEDETKRCLASLWAAHCKTEHQIVVVDDCSPEPALSAWLVEQAAADRIDLISHERNRGFVGAANAGMSRHPDRDVVLLNSDTEVTNDWLDRIVACAESSPHIGTVTPFSNNATICSYPFEGWDGGLPGRLGLTELDRLFAETLSGRVADLPTAIGFCMFVRRNCLNAIGLFDESAFGRGYGEENDFSLRAAKAGWRNVLAADVFVYHRGAVSFGEGRFAQMRRAEATLLHRHPDYNRRVQLFGAANPLAPLREAINQARAAVGATEAAQVLLEQQQRRRANRHFGSEAMPVSVEKSDGPRVNHFFGATLDQLQPPAHNCDQPALLHVAHSWGGGIDRWIHDYAAADDTNWNLLLRSRTGRNAAGVRIELVDLASDDDLLLAWDLDEVIPGTAIAHRQYRRILDELTASFGIEAVIASSLIGHSLDLFDTGLPLVVVLHDFVPFCPALFGWFEKPCETCKRDDLVRCLTSNPLNLFWYQNDADQWLALREAYATKLTKNRPQIAAPSRSVYERYAVLFPVLREINCAVVPHGINQACLPFGATAGEVYSTTSAEQDRLRLLIPARLAPHKGLYLFREMLPQLVEFAEVLLLGCGDFGLPFDALEHVTVIPSYANAELAERAHEFAPDCALLLSTLPESFSYTLSEMRALGIPVLATGLGAFVERIEDGQDGFLVEPDAESVLARLHELDHDRAELRRVATTLRSKPIRSAREMVDDYRRLLDPATETGERPRPGSVAQALVREAAAHRFLNEDNASQQQSLAELTTGLKDLQRLLAHTEVRADAQEKRADAQEARANAQEKRADAQEARANAQEKRADAQEARADAQEKRAQVLTARAKVLEAQLAIEKQRTTALLAQIGAADAREQEILSSTSWRLTRPLRATSRLMGRGRVARAPAVESENSADRQDAAGPKSVSPNGYQASQLDPQSVSASESDLRAESVAGSTTVQQARGRTGSGSGAQSKPVIEGAPSPDVEPGNGVIAKPRSRSAAKKAPAGAADSLEQTPPSGAIDASAQADHDGNGSVRSESSPTGQAIGPVDDALPAQAEESLPKSKDLGSAELAKSAHRASTEGRTASDPPATYTAAPLAQPSFVSQLPHVEVESGNLLALAQAVWLEEALGLVDPFNDRNGDQVPEGFSLVLRAPASTSSVKLAAYFEGLEGMPDASATELAMKADRILAPTVRLAQQYGELWPESNARISVGAFPTILRRTSAGDLHALQRKKIGVPDRTQLVLGAGPVGSRGGLASFARLAMRVCEHRTDIRFVWVGARNPDWEHSHWIDVGLPVTLRRLFLVPDPNMLDWLVAADAYVGCRSAEVYDAAAAEALAAGLPVCVADNATLPEQLTCPPCSQWVTVANDMAVLDWLNKEVSPAFVSTDEDIEQRREQVSDCLNTAGLKEHILSVFS